MNKPIEKLEMPSAFARLAAINVNDHVEKKNGLSYLSWAWAVAELMKADPQANWVIHEPTTYPDGTMMVACTVTAFGKSIYMWLPVMDHRNRAIANPNAFDINKNQMRCLVKAISCHGLGLYIYAGEDLPEEEKAHKEEADAAHIDSLKISYLKEADKGSQSFRAWFKKQDQSERTQVWSLYEKSLKEAMTQADNALAREEK